MNRIRVLPENLANQIAAGEIVERPASVVKELVENAIDAGARAVQVTVESGGRSLVLVRDDGEGMSPDDAILAFEHHATSKIRTAEDLAAISTLGFRGEALPSIGSVSRLTLKTRVGSEAETVPGTEIQIQGGVLRSVQAISWDRGTEVAVRDLFFNLPARRKFLRSQETESGHIARLVTHYVLAHPGIRFALQHQGRILLNAPPVQSLRERIGQVFGDDFLRNLIEICGQSGEISVHGFASSPYEQRSNANSQFFYVNRRMVRDKVITGAVRQAYRNTLPASAYPVVLIFIDLPFNQVDVNAHPAKTEIRFREPGRIHDLIRDNIIRVLERSPAIGAYEHRAELESVIRQPEASVPAATLGDYPRLDFARPGVPEDFFPERIPSSSQERTLPAAAFPEDHGLAGLRAEMLAEGYESSGRPFPAAGARILGQIYDSFIIACDPQGLVIIDQHVAHERILYERMAASIRNRTVETQGLLVPLTLELAPHQLALLDSVLPELNRNGFQVERFGGNAVLIRSVPALAGDCDSRRLLMEILEGLEKEDRCCDIESIRDRIAVSMACRAAIKVNMPLSGEKMQWLLDELAATRIPTNCPHGRPILLRFSRREIERNFGRA